MLALEISSMKQFMNHLLTADTFDCFLLEEASIRTAINYTIDGHINIDFFPHDERDNECPPYEFRPWKDVKSLCFDLIKGKYTPLYFKFILQLKPEHMKRLLEQNNIDYSEIKTLILGIRYDGGKAILTSGVSYRSFVPDKASENIWDKTLCQYLYDKGIGYEKL